MRVAPFTATPGVVSGRASVPGLGYQVSWDPAPLGPGGGGRYGSADTLVRAPQGVSSGASEFEVRGRPLLSRGISY